MGLLHPRGSLPAGKRYPGGSVVLLPDAIAAYAAATGDASVAYRGADGVAPPLIHARLLRDELFAIMEDADLKPDLSQLLHVGHDARLSRPLRPYEVLQRRASLQHIAQKPGGLLITGSLALVSAGDVVVQAHTVFYVPGQRVAPVGTVAGTLPPPLPSRRIGPPTAGWIGRWMPTKANAMPTPPSTTTPFTSMRPWRARRPPRRRGAWALYSGPRGPGGGGGPGL